jgi:hypothetical protein
VNEAGRSLARRQAELSARIELQRLSLQIQTRLLVASRPWAPRGARWPATVLLASAAALGIAAWFARGRIAQSTGTAWRLARLGGRLWVIGKLGRQLVRGAGTSASPAGVNARRGN